MAILTEICDPDDIPDVRKTLPVMLFSINFNSAPMMTKLETRKVDVEVAIRLTLLAKKFGCTYLRIRITTLAQLPMMHAHSQDSSLKMRRKAIQEP